MALPQMAVQFVNMQRINHQYRHGMARCNVLLRKVNIEAVGTFLAALVFVDNKVSLSSFRCYIFSRRNYKAKSMTPPSIFIPKMTFRYCDFGLWPYYDSVSICIILAASSTDDIYYIIDERS